MNHIDHQEDFPFHIPMCMDENPNTDSYNFIQNAYEMHNKLSVSKRFFQRTHPKQIAD